MSTEVLRWLRGEWVEKNPAYTTYKAVGVADDAVLHITGRAHVVEKRALHRHATRRMIRLERAVHPGIRGPSMVGLVDGRPYCIEELPPEDSLEEHLWTTGPLDQQSTIRLGLDLTGILQAAHDIGLVHGGLDLRAVRIDAHGAPVIASWGPVRHGHWHPHCAPETRRSLPQTPADIFGIGYILASCLRGGPIDGAGMAPGWDGRKGSVHDAGTGDLHELVTELLLRHPKERPPSAEEVYQRLARMRQADRPSVLSRWFARS
ncbi:MAG: hypothetical protein GY913_06960 [Proteobacteria bacterium]|nr:hypothetical protein [Pseudomonadota bacterium]MCP4916647.1 hypothetical protein [Pseudomonadota bacterium]